jgi:glycerol-3-phosphate acyltransferase PlsY
LAGRACGIDLRTVGSGNLGATNAFRALGARVALPVLGLDILKGAAAPLVFARLRIDAPPVPDAILATLCGIAAILGHMFPIYLGFRGGKGIATSTGVFAALEPQAFLVCLGIFAAAFAASGGIVSLGSLLASLALPIAMVVAHTWRGDLDWTRIGLAVVLVVIVWIRHHANIARLLRRTEKSVFHRDAAAKPAGQQRGALR